MYFVSMNDVKLNCKAWESKVNYRAHLHECLLGGSDCSLILKQPSVGCPRVLGIKMLTMNCIIPYLSQMGDLCCMPFPSFLISLLSESLIKMQCADGLQALSTVNGSRGSTEISGYSPYHIKASG